AMSAQVGELGVGAPGDGIHRTPSGTFTFDQAFGRQPDPGTKMPYFQATDQDWWDEDAKSPTYNTHVRGSGSPSSIAENLYDSGPVYDYAVNIAVNPQRIPGRVAGIFLHVTDGNPTWGCVAIGRDEMRSVLARPFRVPGNHHRRRKPVAGPIRVVTWQHRSFQYLRVNKPISTDRGGGPRGGERIGAQSQLRGAVRHNPLRPQRRRGKTVCSTPR